MQVRTAWKLAVLRMFFLFPRFFASQQWCFVWFCEVSMGPIRAVPSDSFFLRTFAGLYSPHSMVALGGSDG